MCDLPDYVLGLLNKIATEANFENDYKVDVKPGCKQGDGFLGILASVTLIGKRITPGTGALEPAQLSLVCKMAPTKTARRHGFDSITLFKREAHMYGHVLPQLRAFEREKGLSVAEQFTAYPKCYAILTDDANDQYVIIMEDVRASGYAMWNRSEPLPMDYVLRLLDQLARMHAISFALQDQRPDIYESFKQVTDVVTDFVKSQTMQAVIKASFARCRQAVDNQRHIEMVDDICANNERYFVESLSQEYAGAYVGIAHGDCWINNLLFRKEVFS